MFTKIQGQPWRTPLTVAFLVWLQGVFTEYHTQHHCTQDNEVCVSGTARLSWHDATMSTP